MRRRRPPSLQDDASLSSRSLDDARLSGNPPARSRLPLVFGGLALLWTVHGYSAGEGQALVIAVVSLVALAVATPWSLPATTRAAIWSAVLLVFILMAANLARISPPEDGGALMRAYPYDRVATVALALGVTALFFRPSGVTVTVIATGCMPMLMVALVRTREPEGNPRDLLAVWGALALIALAGQSQRLTRPRPVGVARAERTEWLSRVAWPLLILALAMPASVPVKSGIVGAIQWASGLATRLPDRATRQRGSVLSLQSPPGGFPGRVRPLLSIQAAESPGYLREAVYVRYVRGAWLKADATATPLPEVASESADRWRVYALGYEGRASPGNRGHAPPAAAPSLAGDAPGPAHTGVAPPATTPWRVEVLAPHRMMGLCLPGHALRVQLEGHAAPSIDADGLVSTAEDEIPVRYNVDVCSFAASFPFDTAFPGPPPPLADAYTDVPEELEEAVSGWVAQCDGLAEAGSAAEAVAAVVRHFREYAYSLHVSQGRGARPLEAFMASRRGHCTLFASAAALMLRHRGIPTRVVAGYMCVERHPLTGRWLARERNGHAWCEAWDAEAGSWRLVEATPASGMPDAFPSPGRLRLLAEAIGAGWRGLIHWLRSLNPMVALAEAGVRVYFAVRAAALHPLGQLAGVALVLAGVYRWRRRCRDVALEESEQVRAALTRRMARLEQRWMPAVLRRRADEPWSAWCSRVRKAPLTVAQARILNLAETYQDLRYRPTMDPDRARAWLAAAHKPDAHGDV